MRPLPRRARNEHGRGTGIVGAIVTKSCRQLAYLASEPAVESRSLTGVNCADAPHARDQRRPSGVPAQARHSKCCWRIRADRSGRKRTTAPGPFPKGLVEPGDDLLATAQREFTEETNLPADGAFIALTPVKQKSGKLVHAWAFEADFDLATFASNTFEIEWPPRSATPAKLSGDRPHRLFRAAGRAMTKIIAYQLPLLRELEASACGQLAHSRLTVRPIDFVVLQHPRLAQRGVAPFVPGRQRHDGTHVVARRQH